MGGMNENWLILYNRFIVGEGPGVFAKTASFDHIIRGNVFALKDGKSPMVYLATPDCIGVDLIDNLLCGGSDTIADGMGRPEAMRGNRVARDATAPRPAPPVLSIYEWQNSR